MRYNECYLKIFYELFKVLKFFINETNYTNCTSTFCILSTPNKNMTFGI